MACRLVVIARDASLQAESGTTPAIRTRPAQAARSCRLLTGVGSRLTRRGLRLSIFRPTVLVGHTHFVCTTQVLVNAADDVLEDVLWRMFSSRSLGVESPKNVLSIGGSRTSCVGLYLLGTRTLLLSVFRCGIAPVLRQAKQEIPTAGRRLSRVGPHRLWQTTHQRQPRSIMLPASECS